MSRAIKAVEHEVRELLPPFIYFLVAFSLIVIADALATEQYGIEPFHIVGAVIAAIVAAKALMLADLLPFVDAFPNKPLIYNALWKTMLYVILALFVLYAERIIEFTIRYRSVVEANRRLFGQMEWPRFGAILIWLVVTFLIYAGFKELSRDLGPGSLRRMFTGR